MLGAEIRRLRARRGLTQSDLAAISGVSQPNVSAIESGRRTPSVETFARLVAGCGYDLAASAGDEVIVLDRPADVAPTEIPVAMTIEERQRALVAALELSDAIVRSR
jgi:transcriptional regulator with XRE-family HTH domain